MPQTRDLLSHMQLWCPLEAERPNSKSASAVLLAPVWTEQASENSLQLYPNSSSSSSSSFGSFSSSASVHLPGISVSVSVSVSPTWGTTGRRRPALVGKALAASRFAACRARVWGESGSLEEVQRRSLFLS